MKTKEDVTNEMKKKLSSMIENGVDLHMKQGLEDMIARREQKGPWNDEPDELTFIDEDTKLECSIWRNPEFGQFCGYVTLPDNCNQDYNFENLSVHGGVTFDGLHYISGKRCIGFDCAHAGDWCPYMSWESFANLAMDTYKDIEYVKAQCRKLAKQIYKLKQKGKI